MTLNLDSRCAFWSLLGSHCSSLYLDVWLSGLLGLSQDTQVKVSSMPPHAPSTGAIRYYITRGLSPVYLWPSHIPEMYNTKRFRLVRTFNKETNKIIQKFRRMSLTCVAATSRSKALGFKFQVAALTPKITSVLHFQTRIQCFVVKEILQFEHSNLLAKLTRGVVRHEVFHVIDCH